MSFLDRLSEGLSRTRERFTEQLNVIFDKGPALDEEFWDGLEETLILGDFGGPATIEIIEQLQESAQRLALPDGYAVLDRLAETIASMFTQAPGDLLETNPVCVLFVGINGSGKTTTVGKLAKDGVERGRRVLLGSADTFRAAAIEQLDVWATRANVKVIKRDRGADPASVSFEVIEAAEQQDANLVLIDTAGRLHTSDDLMRELQKVLKVTRKRAEQWQVGTNAAQALPVKTVLVIDATTGQNGLQQAREFNRALQLDGVLLTKLDGTAKGGIAVAVSHELKLPILRIGVGEKIEDLRPFNPLDFAQALIGDTRKK
ncbi:MAG: signal recognition particle-docking protein FtsY [Coriobacteriales bacterium]|jgi:fused signal recognition particle receptor|nr:signal recognition particle-docking protein FtsY [Coriobacteriales bacterium]